MASWPRTVGWNGAAASSPCTYGCGVQSWCPAKSGCGAENLNWAAPSASTSFSVSSRDVRVCRFAALSPTWPRHPGWVQGLQVRGAEPDLAEAPGLGSERVVVAVDDHLRMGWQRRQPAQQVEVVLAERGELLLEVGRGSAVVAVRRGRAISHRGGPVQVVGTDADDNDRCAACSFCH